MTENVAPYRIGNVYTAVFRREALMIDGDPPTTYDNKPGPLSPSGTVIKLPTKANKNR